MTKPIESRLHNALSSDRESKSVEFKREFDPDSTAAWCEITKDIVAIANSGGGVLLVGLNDDGSPSGSDVSKLLLLDPADIANRLVRYIGHVEIDIEISVSEKAGSKIWALEIAGLSIPCIFEKPGTYPDDKKQKTAFSQGTSYFRHGAKSEPGNNNDVTRSIERHLDETRKRWLTGLRKVVDAPEDADIVVVKPTSLLRDVRAVNDPTAVPIRLTRNKEEAGGTFFHEQVSDALFGEINNVIETNRLLFPGRDRFLLGQAAYYRVYSERRRVESTPTEIGKLLSTAIVDYYPFLYWSHTLSPNLFARYISNIYLRPKGNEVSVLLRVAALLGPDFCNWLGDRFKRRWGKHSQPPAWYHRCMSLVLDSKTGNPFAVAIRSGLQTSIEIPGRNSVTVAKLLDSPNECDALLTETCMAVFSGDTSLRPQCRLLDTLCHGTALMSKSPAVIGAFVEIVGESLPEHES